MKTKKISKYIHFNEIQADEAAGNLNIKVEKQKLTYPYQNQRYWNIMLKVHGVNPRNRTSALVE